jgi:hypothetical protein
MDMAENEAAIQIAPSSTFIDRDVGLSVPWSNEKKADKKIEMMYGRKIDRYLQDYLSVRQRL